jgi:GNAT superfamily N-acetyltransferase
VAAIGSVVNAAFAIETFLGGTRTSDENVKKLMHEGAFLVASDSEGCVVASVYVEVCGERGYFGMLAVDPQKQGTGLGRVLTDAAEEYCRQRGCTEIDIRVLSLRTELPPFYRKLGYVETGTEEFHPTRPLMTNEECHCIIMSKRL